MKIAMVTPWMCRCGIFSYSRNLVNALVDLGHEIIIINLPRFGYKTKDTIKSVVSKIPVDKVDIIHVQEEYGLFQGFEDVFYPLLKQLKKPVVTTAHAIGQFNIDNIISEMSDKVIVHNKFCLKRFPYPNAVIIPHGASPLESPPPPRIQCKIAIGIDAKTPIVGYLGYISNHKGLETLIKAMIKIPKVGLLIGGAWHIEKETEYIYRLKTFTLEHLHGRCQWLGFVSDEDLSRVYGAMDIFCYPSRFSTESGALITALSHRKAVLANRIAPFREKEKAGALETFKGVNDLAKKIRRLLKNASRRRDLESGAQKFAEETSWNKVAQKHIELYQEILKKKADT